MSTKVTRILLPDKHTDKLETIFKLNPNRVYLSNWRLTNFGITANAQSNYIALVGPGGIIESMALYDNGTRISGIERGSNLWNSFLNQNKKNTTLLNTHSQTNKLNLGYLIDEVRDTRGAVEVYNKVYSLERYGANTTSALSDLGRLMVSDFIPFLKKSSFVPTNVFKKLELRIRYSQSNMDVIVGNNITSTLRPSLTLEEVVDDNLRNQYMKSYEGVTWFEMEQESGFIESPNVPANDGAELTQTLQLTLKNSGNRPKYIDRMLIMTLPKSGSNIRLRNYESPAQYQESLRVSVKGVDIIPEGGITSANQKLAYLHDSWGNMAMMAVGNKIGTTAVNNYGFTTNENFFWGTTSYYGFNFQRVSTETILTYQRTAINNAGDSQRMRDTCNTALELRIWQEVSMQLSVTADGYELAYAIPQ